MLKKRLGIEAIEMSWETEYVYYYYKIPTTIIIPDSVEMIGRGVLEGCEWLEKVEIPKNIVEIGSWAFDGCERLEKIIIPRSVKNIGFCAFRGCSNAEVIVEMSKNEFELKNIPGLFVSCKSVEYVEEEIRG